MMLIAAANPDPNALYQTLVVVQFVSGLVVTIAAAVAIFGNKRQKREVSFTEQPASREEFERHVELNKEEHDRIFSKIGGVERGANANVEKLRDALHDTELRINKAGEERTTKLHGRVNRVLAAVSRLGGRMGVHIDSSDPDDE